MAKNWTDRILALLASLVAIAIGVQLLQRAGIDVWQPPGWIAGGCTSDPAGLSQPVGPEGRQANYLHTCGNRLYDSKGRRVNITGLNWFGMEYHGHTPEGLATRKWQELLDLVASLGYNTIRLPISNEILGPDNVVNGVSYELNPDLQWLNGLELLDRIVAGAHDRGLKVLLDRHQPTSRGRTPLWYSSEVSEERWIEDWKTLAARYYGDDTVIGFDLHNEPRGEATWGYGDTSTDWRLAAERAGNAVLEVNPYLLIFVEGIENYQGDHGWWGGDLQGVRKDPVRLKIRNRVVYSPHDYGPNVSAQVWFWDPRFPDNLPAEWDRRWGYIHKGGIAPIVVGEFGGLSVGDDPEGKWQRTLLAYLKKNQMGALIWSLNPSWDAGGIVAADWKTVEEDKQQAYQQILSAPLDSGMTGTFGRAPAHYKVVVRQSPTDNNSLALAFRVANDSQDPAELERFELRYWLKAGPDLATEPGFQIDSSLPPGKYVTASLVPTDQGGQDHYLSVRFSSEAGKLGRYEWSSPITIRSSKLSLPRTGDYSYAPPSEPHERFVDWDRVTLYQDGQLVWGKEP